VAKKRKRKDNAEAQRTLRDAEKKRKEKKEGKKEKGTGLKTGHYK